MTSRLGKQAAAILAFVALALSVIVPLSVPKAFSAPDCHRAEVKDYAASIEKVVDELEASKRQKEITGKVESEHRASSFLTVFYVYQWDTAILREVNPVITDRLILTEEQTKQVFGDGAKWDLSMTGPASVLDKNGKLHSVGEGTETFHAEKVEKFDREALTKIITDKVAEFLAKNPQEVCEGGSDTKPGDTTEPTTEPTTPGSDTKPGTGTKSGSDTKPGDNPKPGTDEPTKPGTDSKTAAEPADTGSDTSEPAASDNKPGDTATTDGGNKTPEGGQTVLEGATEAGGLATTGASGLIALGLSAVLIGAGATLAIRRRKQNV